MPRRPAATHTRAAAQCARVSGTGVAPVPGRDQPGKTRARAHYRWMLLLAQCPAPRFTEATLPSARGPLLWDIRVRIKMQLIILGERGRKTERKEVWGRK